MFNIFKTSESEKRRLVERAQLLGNFWIGYIEIGTEGIIQVMNEIAQSPRAQHGETLHGPTESRLFAEMLAFYLHFADRMARETLGAKKRHIFMEALFETTHLAAAKCKKANSTIQTTKFYDFYADFELAHGTLKLGESCGGKGSLFWEVSKRLASITNSDNGPIQEPMHLLMIEGLLLKNVTRLRLPTLMNPRNALHCWTEDLKQREPGQSDSGSE